VISKPRPVLAPIESAFKKGLNPKAKFRNSVRTAKARFYKSDDQTPLKVPASEENIINTYGSANGDQNRFDEQFGAFLSEGDRLVPDRAEIVQNPKLLTMSDSERQPDD